MSFTETTFLFVFLPFSIILYLIVDRFIKKDQIKNTVLVLFSLVFYYWASKESLVFFLVTVVFTYLAGLAIESNKKTKVIVFVVCCLVGALFFYKYAVFVSEWINQIIEKKVINYGKLVVPIGISFVVFEAISYIVDIYRGDAVSGSFLDCITFLALFPKLVSGPIVLWKDFQHQTDGRRSTLPMISKGLDRIVIGYAKKIIIADSFGAQISLINSGLASGGLDIPSVWLKVLLYFLQIYFDFSGYSDIAIGLCEIFGFTIKENFSHPYLSTSISEFWRRWHISLGTWFREYVYIPLGGNRKGNVYIHLFIVFLLTGIWHGSGWNFLIWGIIHGICIVFERKVRGQIWYQKTPSFIKWIVTIIIVFLAWIPFMTGTPSEAIRIFTGLFKSLTTPNMTFTWEYYLSRRTILLLLISLLYEVSGIRLIREKLQSLCSLKGVWICWKISLVLLFVVDILFIVNSTYHPFIYFQF